jgi:flavin reductase (DIM6/NTAB) family NADH-FMN oxidoreductase RutF
MILDKLEIENLQERYRAHLINSLGGFKSLALIGTKSIQENENLAVFSSFFHIGANPALCGIIIRPNQENQNTLGNILNTKSYTINHVLPEFYLEAHQCSAKYPEGISEFKQVGLKSEYLEGVFAPFVKKSKIKFACEFVQKIDIELNGTTLIIGKIIKIIVPNSLVAIDGFIDLEKAGSVTCSGLDSYHQTKKIARLSYAKTDRQISVI